MSTLTRHHFEAADLEQALTSGFDEDDGLRALIHFGDGCPVCHAAFSQLVEPASPSLDPPAESQDSTESPDFISRALSRWWNERRGVHTIDKYLRPIHHAWLLRSCRESHTFARLAVEEAHLTELRKPGAGFKLLEYAVRIFSDPRLSRIGTVRWHALRGLTHVYLASALSFQGEADEASRHFHIARERLEHGCNDHELHAVLYLYWLRADRNRFSFDTDVHLRNTELHLERFLEGRSSPAHLAELRTTQAVGHLQAHQHPEARERFAEALCHIPARCVWARLFVLERLAVLAYRLNDPDSFHRYLPQAEELATRHGFTSQQAALLYLRGNLERWSGNAPGAEQALLEAVAGFERDGHRINALAALADLRTLYLAQDRAQDLPALQDEFVRTVTHPEARPWSANKRTIVLDWAEKFEIPDLEAFAERLRTKPQMDMDTNAKETP